MPPAVVILDLEPMPAVPEATPSEAPPGLELSEVIPEPEPPPPVEMPPPMMAEVTLPEPEPLPAAGAEAASTAQAHREEGREEAAAAPDDRSTRSACTDAGRGGANGRRLGRAAVGGAPDLEGVLLRHLERHKRYPSEAQRARHEGVTYVRFIMSRDGRVLSARLDRPSGFAALDQEGLELLQRAQPLPSLPQDQPGESLEIVVPVQFFVKR